MLMLILIGTVLVISAVVIAAALRRVVPPNMADVVVRGKDTKVYSGDEQVNAQKEAVYYEIPRWVPKWGVEVKRMTLKIIEIQVKNYVTFSRKNARFVLDVSLYCRISNVIMAAKRFPGKTLDDFKEGVRELIIGAIRNTTTSFTVEEVIEKKEEVAGEIEKTLTGDFSKFGVEITNVAVINIADPPKRDREGKIIKDDNGKIVYESTVVSDISAKAEAEINAISRQEVAQREKEALVIEAENREKGETRKIEADEKIGQREQEKDQMIAQKKQAAKEEQMKVVRIEQVKQAEIEAQAKIERAKGTKQAEIEEKTGEAKGIELQGEAEANIILKKGASRAQAQEKYAKALQEYKEAAKWIREIEKDEKIGLKGMEALEKARIQLISTGEMESFIDVFKGKGGANIGAMFSALKATDPELAEKLMEAIPQLSKNKERGEKKRDELNGHY